ncbi:MAG: FG-GAP repeat protein, partial [Deltaproteobacteria bacterium]|nr:FG-GAP repeat protein [Deltaproteobacteria bacterium]
DLDGDGWGELLIGAPKTTTDGVRDTGSIFLVSGGLLNGLQ